MLARATLVGTSSRLSLTAATLGASASIANRNLSSSSHLFQTYNNGRGKRTGDNNRNNPGNGNFRNGGDRNDQNRQQNRANDRAAGSNTDGGAGAPYRRNERFSADGSRKRLPHPNYRDRSQQQPHSPSRGAGVDQQRPPRQKDWSRGPPRGAGEEDGSSLKFGAEPSASRAPGAKAASSFQQRLRSRLPGGGVEDADAATVEEGGIARDDGVDIGDVAALAGGASATQPDGGADSDKHDRHYVGKQKKKGGRGSLLEDEETDGRSGGGGGGDRRGSSPPARGGTRNTNGPEARKRAGNGAAGERYQPPSPVKLKKVVRNVFLPSVISVASLCTKMEVKHRIMQAKMQEMGMQDTRADLMLKFEEAEMIAAEFNMVAVANDELSFDIYPRPPADPAVFGRLPLRPPVVTIMGHVDHGKTTLLDMLRSTQTAKGEPGGITQHIAAFSVPIQGRKQDKGKEKGHRGIQTITFLDTPGHAAFTAMRSRGALVTDIVVLVVAADDGVMPQTLEVIDLVKKANEEAAADSTGAVRGVQMVVALNKMDKIEANPDKVKRELLAAGVELEELGGEIPCVHVSGRSGKGLDDLEETLAVLAELADLRAEQDGPAEGYIVESKVDKGRGNMATVLVRRGILKKGDPVVAGTSWCKVRQIIDSAGVPKASALPGSPVLVTGWRQLPSAGDLLIGGTDEQSCKKAAENRQADVEQRKLLQDVEQINLQRRLKAEHDEAEARREFEERQRRRAARLAADEGRDPLTVLALSGDAGGANEPASATSDADAEDADLESGSTSTSADRKQLNVIIKADFSGTVEAVVGAIAGIGNHEAGVKVVSASVGEPSEGDVAKAAALGATIIGFNVKPSKSVLQQAARAQPHPVPVIVSDVIYRLMEQVSESVCSLLPPLKEARVQGEATISQIFDINLKSKLFKKIAGCKVTNGSIAKSNLVRILRGPDRKVIYQGRLDQFKHLKKDVTEMRKGTECGMSFEGFQDILPDDIVQSYTEVTVPRTL
ncbi:hypothetical protein BCV70DRAFT_198962 [Testicularia cyperi]|uniref:Tr-type G domain-containing protein n=1 Tax=Testicularia cyperi TaxID=1882483 RepID=A0A317XUJ1_9BASI|nr:hypothetical protein BCV70DRAFT_198962 [Testicularia cyperi]